MKSNKLKKWKDSQILYGKPPLNIYRAAIGKLTPIELENLWLRTKEKENNILLIQKIYYWAISALSVGLLSAGVLSLREISDKPELKYVFVDITTALIFFILSYIILAVTLLIVVQSTKNTIQTHLKLIEKRIKETSKEKNNV